MSATLGNYYADISFEVQRNDTYQETWTLSTVDDAGVATAVNLTGCSLKMDICAVAGDGTPIVSLEEEGSLTVTGFKVPADRTLGTWTTTVLGADFSAYGDDMERLELACDLQVTDGSGVVRVYGRGVAIVSPGATS